MTSLTRVGTLATGGKGSTLALTAEQVAGMLADYLRLLIDEIEAEDRRYAKVPLADAMTTKWVLGRRKYLGHISGWLKNHERNRIHSRKHLEWMRSEFARLTSVGAATHE